MRFLQTTQWETLLNEHSRLVTEIVLALSNDPTHGFEAVASNQSVRALWTRASRLITQPEPAIKRQRLP